MLPKHLLRVPAGVGTEPGCPRISFPQRNPPGLPQGPTPSKAAPGLVPAAVPLLPGCWEQFLGFLQCPHGAGGGTAGGWHTLAPSRSPHRDPGSP